MPSRPFFLAALFVAVAASVAGNAAGSPALGDGTSAASIEAELAARGFESINVLESPGRVTVWYENRVYRYEMRAAGIVARIAAVRIDSLSQLEIIPETRGVPFLSLTARASDWIRFLDGCADARWFGDRIAIRAGGGLSSRGRGGGREMSNSRWKMDVAARPLLDFEFGIPGDMARVSAWVAPEATMSPARGTLLTAQAVVRLRDEINTFARPVAPGRMTLSMGGWLPGSFLGAASAGIFPDNRYGFAGEAGRFLFDGALECRAGGDYSGYLEFADGVTLYSSLDAWSAYGALTHRMKGLDVETTVTAGRFMHGDGGVRIDVVRRFSETEFGFFGVDTSAGRYVGFRMKLPLPVERQARPSRMRVATVPDFPWEYREVVSHAGSLVNLYDDLSRFRKGLDPVFVRNNLEDLRESGGPRNRKTW